MDRQIVALLIQESSRFLSQYLRYHPTHASDRPAEDPILRVENMANELGKLEFGPASESTQGGQMVSRQAHNLEIAGSIPAPATTFTDETPARETENKATAVPTGCLPCSVGHLGVCTGLLNEAVRFSRGSDGMASQEVLDRVGMCLDELNAMERVDLRPQMITQLPEWEKELAQKALTESRATRHKLEAMTSPEELETVAGAVQTTRQDLYRTWAKKRLKNMSPEEKTEMTSRILSKLESEEEQ